MYRIKRKKDRERSRKIHQKRKFGGPWKGGEIGNRRLGDCIKIGDWKRDDWKWNTYLVR